MSGESHAEDCPPPPSDAASGPLSPESLVRVLRELQVGRRTGVLSLDRQGKRLGLRFLDGWIVSASNGPGGRLGDILMRSGRVDPLDLERALEKAVLEGRRLGPVLVEEGLAIRAHIREALRLQVRDVLVAASLWDFGTYCFKADEGPTSDEEIDLEMSTTSLIFEVAARLESPRNVLASLLDLDDPLTAVPHAGTRLIPDHADLGPVPSRADGVLATRQIVERARPATPAESPASPEATVALPHASPGLDAPSRKRGAAERLLREMEGKDHLGVLGLQQGASVDEIKQAYFRLAKTYHPDTVRDADLASTFKAIFLRISEAYNVLGSADWGGGFEARLRGGPSRAVRTELPTPAPSPERVQDQIPLPEPAEAVLRAEDLVAAGKAFEAACLIDDVLPFTQGSLRTRGRILRARAYLKTPSGTHVAEKELRELLQEAPDCIQAYLMLAALYRNLGLVQRARGHYDRVLDLQPGHALATAGLRALPAGRLADQRVHTGAQA